MNWNTFRISNFVDEEMCTYLIGIKILILQNTNKIELTE